MHQNQCQWHTPLVGSLAPWPQHPREPSPLMSCNKNEKKCQNSNNVLNLGKQIPQHQQQLQQMQLQVEDYLHQLQLGMDVGISEPEAIRSIHTRFGIRVHTLPNITIFEKQFFRSRQFAALGTNSLHRVHQQSSSGYWVCTPSMEQSYMQWGESVHLVVHGFNGAVAGFVMGVDLWGDSRCFGLLYSCGQLFSQVVVKYLFTKLRLPYNISICVHPSVANMEALAASLGQKLRPMFPSLNLQQIRTSNQCNQDNEMNQQNKQEHPPNHIDNNAYAQTGIKKIRIRSDAHQFNSSAQQHGHHQVVNQMLGAQTEEDLAYRVLRHNRNKQIKGLNSQSLGMYSSFLFHTLSPDTKTAFMNIIREDEELLRLGFELSPLLYQILVTEYKKSIDNIKLQSPPTPSSRTVTVTTVPSLMGNDITLSYSLGDCHWVCPCGMVEQNGVPCCHLIKVVRHYGGMLRYYINTRWFIGRTDHQVRIAIWRLLAGRVYLHEQQQKQEQEQQEEEEEFKRLVI